MKMKKKAFAVSLAAAVTFGATLTVFAGDDLPYIPTPWISTTTTRSIIVGTDNTDTPSETTVLPQGDTADTAAE